MRNYCPRAITICYLSLISLGACSSNIEAPHNSHLGEIKVGSGTNATALNKKSECEVDLAKEAELEKMCLQAWRKCTGGDPKLGIADLKKLCKQYPKSSSVLFMTGQAIEKFGNKKEAISFYEKAANDSDFAIMSLYKIAESLRTTGNTEESILRYRKLIAIAPQFREAHLGLALALKKIDPNSKEAQGEMEKANSLEETSKQSKDSSNKVVK